FEADGVGAAPAQHMAAGDHQRPEDRTERDRQREIDADGPHQGHLVTPPAGRGRDGGDVDLGHRKLSPGVTFGPGGAHPLSRREHWRAGASCIFTSRYTLRAWLET